MKAIIGEILLDDLAAVAAGDREIGETERGIVAHHVPQDRPLADLDHRLGLVRSFFRYAGAVPAGQNYDLHQAPARRAISLGFTPYAKFPSKEAGKPPLRKHGDAAVPYREGKTRLSSADLPGAR